MCWRWIAHLASHATSPSTKRSSTACYQVPSSCCIYGDNLWYMQRRDRLMDTKKCIWCYCRKGELEHKKCSSSFMNWWYDFYFELRSSDKKRCEEESRRQAQERLRGSDQSVRYDERRMNERKSVRKNRNMRVRVRIYICVCESGWSKKDLRDWDIRRNVHVKTCLIDNTSIDLIFHLAVWWSYSCGSSPWWW